jgi:hypothetical protein
VESNLAPITVWRDKENVVYKHYKILFSHNEILSFAKNDGSGGHYVERNKIERKMSHILSHM